MEEMSRIYAKLLDQYKMKYNLTFLVLCNLYGKDKEIIFWNRNTYYFM